MSVESMLVLRAARVVALAALTVLAAAALPGKAVHAADAISVLVDEARLVKVPERTTTLVIGNPLIADVTIQPGGVMIITGKGYGATNLVALDRSGTVVMDRLIEVTAPNDKLVTVFCGVERETYSCAPDCQRRIMMGDAVNYYSQTLGQTTARAAAAAAMAAGAEAQ